MTIGIVWAADIASGAAFFLQNTTKNLKENLQGVFLDFNGLVVSKNLLYLGVLA